MRRPVLYAIDTIAVLSMVVINLAVWLGGSPFGLAHVTVSVAGLVGLGILGWLNYKIDRHP